MSSAGGGEEGRGGGPSLVDPLRSLLSGMKLGGGMLVGGGGSLGGGGKDITGGRVLSTDVRMAEADGTRDLGCSSAPVVDEIKDSIDWRLSEAIALRRPNVPVESLKTLVSGVFTGEGALKTGALGEVVPAEAEDGGGGAMNWN